MWYETLRPIEVDWTGLQEHFRQQYSKFGSTKEQLFHMWRLFQYDENSDIIESYISKIKRLAALLNYGKPQILEVFKNTLPSKLYWILFPINNLRDAVDATNRVLTKEKIDKQLSGQAGATTPFVKVGDTSHPDKKVSFDVQDPIRGQLESLTSMVYNMSIQKEENSKHLSLKSIKREVRDKTDKILVTKIEVEHLIMTDRDKILDPTIGDNHKTGNVGTIMEGETTDIKIIVEMTVGTEEDKILEVIITEAEVQHQEAIEDIIAQTQIKELEVDQIQE